MVEGIRARAVSLENSSHGGIMIAVIKHRKGHHIKEKIGFHYITLEAELGPVGGFIRSQLLAQYGNCLFNVEMSVNLLFLR